MGKTSALRLRSIDTGFTAERLPDRLNRLTIKAAEQENCPGIAGFLQVDPQKASGGGQVWRGSALRKCSEAGKHFAPCERLHNSTESQSRSRLYEDDSCSIPGYLPGRPTLLHAGSSSDDMTRRRSALYQDERYSRHLRFVMERSSSGTNRRSPARTRTAGPMPGRMEGGGCRGLSRRVTKLRVLQHEAAPDYSRNFSARISALS